MMKCGTRFKEHCPHIAKVNNQPRSEIIGAGITKGEEMSEDKIKKCLVQELKELNDKLKHYDWREETRDIYMANCIGYAQALCWVLGRDRLYELLQNKYCNL